MTETRSPLPWKPSRAGAATVALTLALGALPASARSTSQAKPPPLGDRIVRSADDASFRTLGRPGAPQESAPLTVLVLTGANVVDVEAGEILPGRALVIADGRIARLGPTDEVEVPEGAEVIDVGGRYVTPGLADMHVHIGPEAAPLFLANGVTTVRVMMGSDETLAWRRESDAGDSATPRVFVAGPLLAGEEVPWPHERIDEPEEARASVQRQAAAGYDFVKVYEGLSLEAYRAIVEEARRSGLAVIGHVPMGVGLEEVLFAGQRSIEHAEQLMYATFGRDGVMTLPFERADEIVETLRGNEGEVFVTPTLAGQERIQLRGTDWHEGLFSAPEMRWADPALEGWWSMGRGQPPSAEALERRGHFLEFQRRLTLALQRAGVPLLAGTDTPYPLLVPGFSLHHELEALVEAGLSPLEALRTATLNAGRFLERPEELGIVRPGAVADLVIVDGNPLADIGALRRPWAVVSRGFLLDRDRLDALLEDAVPS